MKPTHDSSEQLHFGAPSAGSQGGEKRLGLSTAEELQRIHDAYEALDELSQGAYSEFLTRASSCRKCHRDACDDGANPIKPHLRPIPLMCGGGSKRGDPGRWASAHAALEKYRGADGKLRFNVSETNGIPATASVEAFLRQHRLTGLSLGHCGWGDMAARVRGSGMREGVKLMILGADWYPISKCANFLIDRHDEIDNTLRKFMRNLFQTKHDPDVAKFLVEHRVYLGNTLLCYRNGTDTVGTANIPRQAFVNCREHLRRHILAVKPEVLVTFGAEPFRSVANIAAGVGARSESIMGALRKPGASLKRVMEEAYEKWAPDAVEIALDGYSLRYVPLNHPSFGFANKYEGEYAALARALGLAAA